jgi:fatty acid desaturase
VAEPGFPVGDGPAGADRPEARPERRMPDPFALLVGLFALGVAGTAIIGWMPSFDPRWMLAAAAAVLGVLLLVGSLRNRG